MTVSIELQPKLDTSASMKLGRLGDYVEILSGFAFDSSRFGTDGEMPLIRIRDVVRGRTETYYSGPFNERFVVQRGDLLVGMDGDFNRETWSSEPALLNQRVCRISPREAHLDSRYLYHFLPRALMEIWHATPFATVKHLSVKSIREIAVPLPPLDEQRRIAGILDKADELRTKRRQALAYLDVLTRSTFNEMFGDPTTNPKGWRSQTFGELISGGPQNGLYKPASDYGSGTPIVRIDSFSGGTIQKIHSLKRLRISASDMSLYGLQEGDILINRVNSIEHLGKSALVPHLNETIVFESNMMRCKIENSTLDATYMSAFLQSQFIRNQISIAAKRAVNQASINQTDVKSFIVRIPPIEMQQEFAERVAVLEVLRTASRRQLAVLEALLLSLQHRAFEGTL